MKLVAAMMGKDFDDLSAIKPEGTRDFKAMCPWRLTPRA